MKESNNNIYKRKARAEMKPLAKELKGLLREDMPVRNSTSLLKKMMIVRKH